MNIQGVSGQFGMGGPMGMRGGSMGMQGGPQGPMGGNEEMQTAMMDKLSEATGLSTDDLKASFEDGSFKDVIQEAGLSREDMQSLRAEVIDEGIAAGTISEDFADKLQSGPPAGVGRPPMTGHGGPEAMKNMIGNLATELGYESAEDFLSAIPEDSSPWEVAESNGVDMQQFLYDTMFDTFI